ncbi:MAG: DAK2 domain-containing protein, partial [Arachnia sp.]
ELWCAPALTPAFQRGAVAMTEGEDPVPVEETVAVAEQVLEPGSPASQAVAARVRRALQATEALMRGAEAELGRIDAIAGDGDHGRGMVRGSAAAAAAAVAAADAGVGVADLLNAAGASWADQAGGTSGVLWGAALQAAGDELGNDREVGAGDVTRAARAFVERMQALGKAQPGDKTMLDAAVPYVDALAEAITQGTPLQDAAVAASAVATQAAQSTAALTPRVGRARPLAAKSVGTPDPGAVSFAMIVTEIHEVLS